MHADIDEGAEGGDVGDHAFELHAGLQVGDLLDALLERRGLELGTRIAARLLEFGEDVGDRRHAEAARRRIACGCSVFRNARRRSSPSAAASWPRRSSRPPDRLPDAPREASSGFVPFMMRRKPAACSNAFGPSRGTFFSAARALNAPFSSRIGDDVLRRSCALSPATRASSGADAVFTSTPTEFTQSSTTASSERARPAWSTSCWYWPTPIALGSILTSSASGSCRRRAMETAPRSETSRSGNSFAASSDAE